MFTAFEQKHPVLAFRMPAILYAGLIFAMSAVPGDELPELPFISFDKIVHSVEFGLLGILVFRALRFPSAVARPYLWTLLLCALYGASDELHQLFVPGRFASPADFLFDVMGVAVFAGISAWIHKYPAECC